MGKTLFAVMQSADGTIYVDWHPDLYSAVDPDGKTTDRVIDIAEELLSAENDDDED